MKHNHLIILLFLMIGFSHARAQNALTFVEVVKNGANGLSGVSDIAVSADGKFVYSAAYSNSAVVCFNRDVYTGKLTYSSIIRNGIGGITGIVSAFSIAASSDNKSIYVASPSGNITAFSRDVTSGALSFVNTVRAGIGNAMTIGGFVSVYVSPDGKWVYGIGGQTSLGIAVFSRNPDTGAITFIQQQVHAANGNELNQDYSPTSSPIKNIATSKDGQFLYVTATISNTVSVYSIHQTTGFLTLVKVYKDGASGVDGIMGASSLLLSPDGKFLYVSGQKENAIAIFSVDQNTGMLTYVNKVANNVGGITSLNGVRSLAVSPDGKYVYASAITSNAVTAFRRDASSGLLTLSTVLKDGEGGVDGLASASGMMMDPLSRHLYVAGQGDAGIAVLLSSVPAVVLSTNEVTTANNVSVVLDAGLEINDSDSEYLISATVKVSAGMSGDILSVTPQHGIIGVYDANAKTLSLTGRATLSQYRDVLRSISYTPSVDPNVTPGTISYRTIAINVLDEDNNLSADAIVSVKINSENPVPVITFPVIANKFYGDPAFNLVAQSSNTSQAITYTSSNVEVAEIVSGQVKIKSAGTVTITATQSASSGFGAALPVERTFIVNPKVLTITADAKSKVYGAALPVLTYSYEGLVNGDTKPATLPTIATTASTSSAVGNYPITLTGGSDANYTIEL
ncbi:beta-propeller fold lactonase family protein, partial [Sphingobacterium psychroaquaticum]